MLLWELKLVAESRGSDYEFHSGPARSREGENCKMPQVFVFAWERSQLAATLLATGFLRGCVNYPCSSRQVPLMATRRLSQNSKWASSKKADVIIAKSPMKTRQIGRLGKKKFHIWRLGHAARTGCFESWTCVIVNKTNLDSTIELHRVQVNFHSIIGSTCELNHARWTVRYEILFRKTR